MAINKLLNNHSIEGIKLTSDDIIEMHTQLKNMVSEGDRVATLTNDIKLKEAVAEGYVFLEKINRICNTLRRLSSGRN